LQRNVFFNDEMRINNMTTSTHQFDLHGPEADRVIERVFPGLETLAAMHGKDSPHPRRNITTVALPSPTQAERGGEMQHVSVSESFQLFVARNKPVVGEHWTLVVPIEQAAEVWQALTDAGATPAGSLTYNTLRIRAGRPGIGRELSQDYIPLEVGLWDEVNFKKGCYTGQEIIARMESRSRLAKVMVTLRLDGWVEAPAEISYEGRSAGMLTSSVLTPDGDILGIGVVKLAAAHVGETLVVGAGAVHATITAFAGTPPPIVEMQEAKEN
jgi:aminomethyltransferase